MKIFQEESPKCFDNYTLCYPSTSMVSKHRLAICPAFGQDNKISNPERSLGILPVGLIILLEKVVQSFKNHNYNNYNYSSDNLLIRKWKLVCY